MQVTSTADGVGHEIELMSNRSDSLNDLIRSQQNSLETVSASVTQMSASAEEVSTNADVTAKTTEDANAIGQQTRRGKGNMIICSADVASALQMAGVLDYTPALNNNLNVDDTSTTFAGVMNGRYKVYVDPYAANVAASQYYVVGYKGTSPYDAGMFYCPYVPLQMVRAVGENTFQPKIGFKTRYGIAANPFHTGTVGAGADGAISISSASNKYYRKVKVTNLM